MTHSSIINISSDRIIQWMNLIRNTSGNDQYRLLENFWASQIKSKAWLINTLKSLNVFTGGDVYIFGGWFGVLASLIKDNFLCDMVYSIDVDPLCEKTGSILDNKTIFVTKDMSEYYFDSQSNVGLVINTSTEHIEQKTFDKWMTNMPENVPIILQGNNFFECQEHIRCTHTLEEFTQINKLNTLLFKGELDCIQFTRFMSIGFKNVL